MKKNCTKYVSQWVTLYEKVSKPILRAVHKAVLTGIIAIITTDLIAIYYTNIQRQKYSTFGGSRNV